MASKVSNSNQRNGPLTECKICRRSIFDRDERTWVNKPTPGLAHVRCLPKD